MRFILPIVLLFPGLVLAQISGRVIDAHTRLPLENVQITLSGGILLYTDESGTFHLNPDHTEETVLASHIGYVTQEFNTVGRGTMLFELHPDPEQLEAVTVSAAAFTDKIRNQTSSLSLMLNQNVRFQSQEHISGWINQVPGIYMHNGGYNTNRLTIRGMGSREPYGSNRIKAYLNDIPISGGDGATVIEDFSLSGIQRVEILKGPSSALYGAGLGGTLRLFTPYPGGSGFGINTLHQTGSSGLQKHALNAHFKKGVAAISLDIGRQQSGGFRDNSKYYNNHFLLNGDLFLKRMQVGILVSYIDMKAHIPSSLDDSTFNNDPSAAATNWMAIQGYEKYGKFLAGLSISSEFDRHLSQKTTVFAGRKALYESRPFNILENNTSNFGMRSKLQLDRAGFQSIVGLELFVENIEWSTYETLQGERGTLQDDIEEIRYYTNFFNLYKWSFGERFILEAGWNLGLVRFSLVGSNNQDYPEETLLPEGIRNNELKPEKGWNFELGTRGEIGGKRLTYDISTYMIFVKNLLITKRISEEIFTGINAGSTIHKGVESHIRLYFTHAFQYSVNRFKEFYTDGVNYSSHHLPGIPVYKNHFKLTWTGPMNLESGISLLMVGRQYIADDNEKLYSRYQVVDLNLSWAPDITEKFGFTIAAGLNNVFDRSYASMILINAPSSGNATEFLPSAQDFSELTSLQIVINSSSG